MIRVWLRSSWIVSVAYGEASGWQGPGSARSATICFRLAHRKIHAKRRSDTLPAIRLDSTAVVFDDFVADGEPKPDPDTYAFCRESWVEDALQVCLGASRAPYREPR